ncbi:hypothetical protein BD779DRAFT_1667976 [Infundibulicybe gibba]|nr:hypothetical protein BD779DRAFT_1667976 [Infundibulicybe gibba]
MNGDIIPSNPRNYTTQVRHALLSLRAFVGLMAVNVVEGHQFNFVNRCGSAITPVIANTNCGYSPRCSTPGSGGVPNPAILTQVLNRDLSVLAAQKASLSTPKCEEWNGRIFAQNGHCGASGESCTITEFNLDTGSQFTAQAYDISNIQGFTQSIQIAVNGCEQYMHEC